MRCGLIGACFRIGGHKNESSKELKLQTADSDSICDNVRTLFSSGLTVAPDGQVPSPEPAMPSPIMLASEGHLAAHAAALPACHLHLQPQTAAVQRSSAFGSSGTFRADFTSTGTGSSAVPLISKPIPLPFPGPGVPFLREAMIFSSSPAIITLFTCEGKPLYQNAASKEYFGARTSCRAAATTVPGSVGRAAEPATGSGGGGSCPCGFGTSFVTTTTCQQVSARLSREGATGGAAGAAEDLLSQVFLFEPAKLEALLRELGVLTDS
ncbi:hypothetical protein Vretifemale_11138, partial [Volvox reticuliferus]